MKITFIGYFEKIQRLIPIYNHTFYTILIFCNITSISIDEINLDIYLS